MAVNVLELVTNSPEFDVTNFFGKLKYVYILIICFLSRICCSVFAMIFISAIFISTKLF